MKKLLSKLTEKRLILFLITLFLAFPLTAQEMVSKKVLLTGPQLWEKVISHYDPNNKWASFSGKMHLFTIFSEGNRLSEEILEIRKPENFYQCTQIAGDIKAIKGIKAGQCFHTVNGDPNPPEEQIEEYGMDCDKTGMFKEHHTCHFGLPMELRTSGVDVENNVEMVNFNGLNCYALKFAGNSDAVTHSYYARTWTLYIDPITYAMRGTRWQSQDDPGAYLVIAGEFEIAGIRIPQVKTVFHNKDGSHLYTDIFNNVEETMTQK